MIRKMRVLKCYLSFKAFFSLLEFHTLDETTTRASAWTFTGFIRKKLSLKKAFYKEVKILSRKQSHQKKKEMFKILSHQPKVKKQTNPNQLKPLPPAHRNDRRDGSSTQTMSPFKRRCVEAIGIEGLPCAKALRLLLKIRLLGLVWVGLGWFGYLGVLGVRFCAKGVFGEWCWDGARMRSGRLFDRANEENLRGSRHPLERSHDFQLLVSFSQPLKFIRAE